MHDFQMKNLPFLPINWYLCRKKPLCNAPLSNENFFTLLYLTAPNFKYIHIWNFVMDPFVLFVVVSISKFWQFCSFTDTYSWKKYPTVQCTTFKWRRSRTQWKSFLHRFQHRCTRTKSEMDYIAQGVLETKVKFKYCVKIVTPQFFVVFSAIELWLYNS